MRSLRWLESTLQSGDARARTWVRVRGASMEPAYTDGDWLLVEPILAGPPVGRGDVVLARRDDRLVCHRVVDLGDGAILPRGDACAATDTPLPSASILGRVIEARRGPGWRP